MSAQELCLRPRAPHALHTLHARTPGLVLFHGHGHRLRVSLEAEVVSGLQAELLQNAGGLPGLQDGLAPALAMLVQPTAASKQIQVGQEALARHLLIADSLDVVATVIMLRAPLVVAIAVVAEGQ
jgi:hypothetical protein